MINLLRSDFYKLLRSKSLYICAACFAVCNFITVLTLKLAESLIGEIDSINGSTVLLMPFSNTFLPIFLSIIISIFITSDFSSGTMKNIASKGFPREKIYLSKLICSLCATLFVLIVSLVITTGLTTAFYGFGKVDNNYVAESFVSVGLGILANIGLASIIVMFSFMFRKNGSAIAISLCTFVLFNLVLELISMVISRIIKGSFSITEYWIVNIVSETTKTPLATSAVVRDVVASLAYIIITAVLGTILFKKNDIK